MKVAHRLQLRILQLGIQKAPKISANEHLKHEELPYTYPGQRLQEDASGDEVHLMHMLLLLSR